MQHVTCIVSPFQAVPEVYIAKYIILYKFTFRLIQVSQNKKKYAERSIFYVTQIIQNVSNLNFLNQGSNNLFLITLCIKPTDHFKSTICRTVCQAAFCKHFHMGKSYKSIDSKNTAALNKSFQALFGCLVGFITSSSTTGLYRGRAPRQERLTILRAATHETELGDHDFCLSRSHYTDTAPTSRERAATAGIEPWTFSPGVARSTD